MRSNQLSYTPEAGKVHTSRAVRGHRRGIAVLVFALGALGFLFVPARADRTSKPTLTVDSDHVVGDGGRLHEITVESPALGHSSIVRVLLPVGYDDAANAGRQYPVLLLLHGASADERAWSTHFDFPAHHDADGLIVVMPDGGRDGFYSDWEDGPAWESYHIGELLPWVDHTYRTYGDRAHRGIAGLSMGGYGAMEYASRHPDLFVAAGSFSGAVDITFGGDGADYVLEAGGVGDPKRWGTYADDTVTWQDHNPADLMGNLGPTKATLYTGNGLPNLGDNVPSGLIELGVFGMNTSYHRKAVSAGIPIEYHAYGLGTHEWSYWDHDLEQWLPELNADFADPPAVPSSFDYRSAEPSFSVWGWTFAVQRSAKATLQLTHVSDRGFVASADQAEDLVVDTAPDFHPGTAYRVAGGAGDTVTADAEGRLHFTLPVGGHTTVAINPAR